MLKDGFFHPDAGYSAMQRQKLRMDGCLTLAYAYHERDPKLSQYYVRLAQEYFEQVIGAVDGSFSVLDFEQRSGLNAPF
jgi:hypothetical protein